MKPSPEELLTLPEGATLVFKRGPRSPKHQNRLQRYRRPVKGRQLLTADQL